MSASGSQDLLILQLSSLSADKVREFLNSKGFSTQLISDLRKVSEALSKLVNPILIVDCGRDEGRSKAYIKRLLQSQDIMSYPLVVIGAGADKFESELNKVFPVAATLNHPYEHSALFEGISFISRTFQQVKGDVADLNQVEGQKTAPVEKQDHAKVPRLVFEQFFSLNIVERFLGGDQYIFAIQEDRFKDSSYFPDGSQAISIAIANLCEDVGKWGGPHLHRLAYLVHLVMSALSLDESLKISARQAAFFIGWGFAERAKRLMRRDYFSNTDTNYRSEIAEMIRKSAKLVDENLHLNQTRDLLETVAQLVANERGIDHDAQTITASAVMASDLVDRVCWQSGYWNPHAACRFLRGVKAGKLSEIHPAVLCCVVKILSEAVVSTSPRFLLDRRVSSDPLLLEKAKQLREQQPEQSEEKVPITALAPGMKLSRPLFSFDGKQVLDADLILDQDLIWRIWQLSAIRPLNAPLIVRQKRERVPAVELNL